MGCGQRRFWVVGRGFFLDLVDWGDAGCLDFAVVWLRCWMVVGRLLRVLDGFVEFVCCGGI